MKEMNKVKLEHRGTDFAGKIPSWAYIIMAPGSEAKADTMLAQI